MTIDVQGHYLVGAGDSLTITDTIGFQFIATDDGSPSVLVNEGDITVTRDGRWLYGVIGRRQEGPAHFWNREGASLTVEGGVAVSLSGGDSLLRNDGVISSTEGGISVWDGGPHPGHSHFLNTGTVTTSFTGWGEAVVIWGDFRNTGDVSSHFSESAGESIGVHIVGALANTGHIAADGVGPVIGVKAYGGSIVRNSGDITVHSDTHASVGIYVDFQVNDFVRIRNSGTLTADQAIYGHDLSAQLVLHNSGVINGDVVTSTPGARIYNSGSMVGDLHLGAWNDIYNGRDGHLDGVIEGGSGDDRLHGGTDAEVIYGDLSSGGSGNDLISGGGGGDQLYGGRGHDVFVYYSLGDSAVADMDAIHDLATHDRLDLSRIDADVTQDGNQAFVHVAAFSAHAGELVIDFNKDQHVSILQADVDGDGVADFQIQLNGDKTDFGGLVL